MIGLCCLLLFHHTGNPQCICDLERDDPGQLNQGQFLPFIADRKRQLAVANKEVVEDILKGG
jgi:hypothetical protein